MSVDASTLAYGTTPTAKERYLTLMEENPELLQDVPLKYLASYPVSYTHLDVYKRQQKTTILCVDTM